VGCNAVAISSCLIAREGNLNRDIFEFWSGIADSAKVHPEDEAVFNRVSHHFEKDCLPIAFFGPLRDARVVLLFLSPGYTEFDKTDADTTEGRAHYSAQRGGYAKLPSPEEHGPRNRWISGILRQFGCSVSDVADQVAVLNIGAYHSRKFRDRHMLSALPSSRVAIDWAQSKLFPAAEAGSRTVICLRSAPWWGLQKGKCPEKALFAPICTPGGIMCHGKLRNRVIEAFRASVRVDREFDAAVPPGRTH
jgi:hypothetical protein